MVEKNYKNGQFPFREGDNVDGVFFVRDGEFEIHKEVNINNIKKVLDELIEDQIVAKDKTKELKNLIKNQLALIKESDEKTYIHQFET
jgi:hypothetical protein